MRKGVLLLAVLLLAACSNEQAHDHIAEGETFHKGIWHKHPIDFDASAPKDDCGPCHNDGMHCCATVDGRD